MGTFFDEFPLGYHITFGTYGTRLHGDARGTVDRLRNKPGDPIIGRNEDWERMERSMLRYAPVMLSEAQRAHVESVLPAICERGGWRFGLVAAQADHVHVLLEAHADGKAIRNWLKRWLGESLSAHWTRPAGASWWSEGGSVKWLWDEGYRDNVYAYIHRQRLRQD